MSVYPKKYLGQHFLKDETLAVKIVDALALQTDVEKILEIGPGTGILTRFLIDRYEEKGN